MQIHGLHPASSGESDLHPQILFASTPVALQGLGTARILLGLHPAVLPSPNAAAILASANLLARARPLPIPLFSDPATQKI